MAALCGSWLSSSALFTWDGEENAGGRGTHHIESWLLYHWLWNMRPKQLAAFQRRLALAENPDTAWRRVFPEFDPTRRDGIRSLDNALYRHRRDPRGVYFRRKAEAVARYTETPLSPSDVHLLLVDARYSVQPRKARSAPWLRPELIKVLQEDPHQAVALSWRAELDGTSALAPLRESVEKRPGDWRAWLLLGDAEEKPEQKHAAYQVAVKLNPDSALAQDHLALQLASSGQPMDAVPFAKRAVELAPWDAHATATLARVDVALGACDEAVEARNRAVQMAGGDAALDGLVDAVARCVPSPENFQ